MANGDEVQLGRVRLSVLETPGHSPESISILVFDPEQDDDRPHAVMTGDTLFIGDVGRPDLRASLGWSADQLASLLYDSLRDKLLSLPDDTLVYPAHGAGSLCGKNLSTDTVSTIGVQRAYNYALQPMSRERFIEIVTTDQPDTRAYFTYDFVLNARERPTLADARARAATPLTRPAARARCTRGATAHTRDQAEFEDAHCGRSWKRRARRSSSACAYVPRPSRRVRKSRCSSYRPAGRRLNHSQPFGRSFASG